MIAETITSPTKYPLAANPIEITIAKNDIPNVKNNLFFIILH
jgi:hypothetical protein